MSRRGFTLVEMVAVTVVLAMVAAIVMPNLAAMTRGQAVRSFRAALPRMVTQARELAIQQGSEVTIRFDNGSFVIERAAQDQNDDAQQISRVQVPGDVTPSKFEVGGSEAGDGDWAVKFYADGKADSAGVEFAEGNSFWYMLTDAQTGKARLLNGEMPVQADEEWEAGTYVQRT